MAACDSLQPVVLLTDVMDIEAIFVPEGGNGDAWLEQTEPLDLCLGGALLDGLIGYRGEESGESEDDVIFVKEYKVKGAKRARKAGAKGAPRRNPVRKARVTKRFEDYTDESFEDDDFFEETAEDGDFVDVAENKFPSSTKNEDCEDWKVEDVLKRNRQRKKPVSRKIVYKNKLGRKRKFNNCVKTNEKKILLKELEPLIVSNLLLIKNYVSDVKNLNELVDKEEINEYTKSERTKNARSILQQQAILCAVTKNIIDDDVFLKCLTE